MRKNPDFLGMTRICPDPNLSLIKLTGEWHGDVEAELTDFSFSSGISTEDMRAFRAERSRRVWTGLEGAENRRKNMPSIRNINENLTKNNYSIL